jgi:hypothetical protein
VFRRNLENATKVPGDIGGQRVFKGFLTRVLTNLSKG